MKKIILLKMLFLVSYFGLYSQDLTSNDSIPEGSTVDLKEVVLTSGIIDVARERQTPIAVSTIGAEALETKMGNQEFVDIMANTPGIFVNNEKGGYGDGYVYIRGFSQTNSAFLINGIPVNDMENGKVYWSNWMVLSDFTDQIQIQRGLGSSSLAVPSVGGTVSIFTKSAERPKGGFFRQMIGNDGFSKTTFNYNTGMNDKGWSSSYLVSYWEGDGYVDGTEGEGWNYAFSLGYKPSERNRFEFSFLGAGQWHHQRDHDSSIRDHLHFGGGGVNSTQINNRWNADYGTRNGETFNIERNFYHKPIATLNWDHNYSDKISVNTSLYASYGTGGGTGTRGRNYDIFPRGDLYNDFVINGNNEFRRADGTINWDAVVLDNRSSVYTDAGNYGRAGGRYDGYVVGTHGGRGDGLKRDGMFRRSSMNNHNWFGGITKINIKGKRMNYSFNLDFRDYTGFHYQAMNDLLGADAFLATYDRNSAGQFITTMAPASPFKNIRVYGPKANYFDVDYVGWIGAGALAEYSSLDNKLTAVVQMGLSQQSFQEEDLFGYTFNQVGEEVTINGGYIKGGANYNISEKSNVFFNAGIIDRQPFKDAVFPNYGNIFNEDVQNEEITSFELGYGFTSRKLKANVNLYSTVWGNRFIETDVTLASGDEGNAQFTGVEQTHNGIEVEAFYYPSNNLKISGMISAGDWKYTQNFNATILDENNQAIGTSTLYMDGVKVGQAAQFVSYLEADYRLGSNLRLNLGWRSVDGLYGNYFNYEDGEIDDQFYSPNNRGAVKFPSYNLIDFGASYRFVFDDSELFARLNVNNLFDETYINYAMTNIHADSGTPRWNGVGTNNFVNFGYGTTWNFSLQYKF
jgi:outer membrane cobalamin receptor